MAKFKKTRNKKIFCPIFFKFDEILVFGFWISCFFFRLFLVYFFSNFQRNIKKYRDIQNSICQRLSIISIWYRYIKTTRHDHTWTRQRMRQGELNECLVRALWNVGSSFAEASNKAALKRMTNAFSLKYQLETDSILSASACLVNGWMQFASPLWLVNVCMHTDLGSFKSGHDLINLLMYMTETSGADIRKSAACSNQFLLFSSVFFWAVYFYCVHHACWKMFSFF